MKQNKPKKTKNFKFKQFVIEGGYAGMAVSTDGVLLGAWSRSSGRGQLLDIGTGTGLLALMCAQRFPQLEIIALDIDELAYQAAQRNVINSPWSERISVIHHPLSTFSHLASSRLFDSIVCNPPYFNSGESAQDAHRATARHTHQLSHYDLVQDIQRLLSQSGKASLILPLAEGEHFITFVQQHQLFITRRCDVRPTSNKPVSRLLIELSKTEQACECSELTIMHNAQYTAAFIALTHEFYLKM
ncbi:methyltransferase [Vibrio sp. FNV 38]|nr:methyltransferase [Vibrio sp. FNV 38]